MRVRRGAGAAVSAALVLALSSCSGADDGVKDPDPSPAAASSRTGKPEPAKETKPAVPVANPAHAVDPPGKRDGRLWSADILVQWDKEIDDDLVKRIEKLKGVAHTE